jgi:hypothetical protein
MALLLMRPPEDKGFLLSMAAWKNQFFPSSPVTRFQSVFEGNPFSNIFL